ncbi:SDR family NAD(P)-dependent oxidoreductase [Devosia sp. J2-20]|jgi:NAD(P)-dependent dehydrogenase (short-subunit alcohol dehydrogenase family)|uniref:SDR family NAD(P)-dependent oxidoreductase n=1 Tax=Devosia litorisediminis TaxID=2829817 RepID=A0A942ECT2_9HYPH|nr:MULTISPECIES: SDR family NAD(P)-dependent oxidoreductase [Devosia]MBS3848944.1 SDR family NAD(P)-dependent oxidoreductase [Devosia litorisediminis]MCZ4346070.1 SDR family NAD(P)-dependent oxidoreductase [Devosia neptuniae]WDQ97978.1 SDR family NAD(P)-dependent oxidoreductase [Devosia sp. J2-20]|tara:strand:- start:6503 stop:7237 length:735 start_codon:yes stop_codon:yes gene_type:complete
MAVDQDLAGKVVLVTGASRGIGYAAALEAARRGAHVVAVARTVGGLEELDDEIQDLGSSATLVPLDLRDGDAIDRLGAAIFERWGALDGLIANAGQLGVLSPLPHVKPEDFDKVIAVNVTANYRLLRSTDLLLRQAEAGRAVFVSSGAAKSARPFWGLYAASKAAVDAMVKSYSGEIAQTKVKANIFYPGQIRTAMRAKAMPGEDPNTLPTPADIAPKLVDMISPAYKDNGKLFNAADDTLSDL